MDGRTNLEDLMAQWRLPEGDDLLDRLERMIYPALWSGHFGSSYTRMVTGLQYHLGGAQDTEQLATLAGVSSADQVLDVCCFLGGPAIQLANSYGCRVTGIDGDKNVIQAATRLVDVAGLAHVVDFRVADAAVLPFEDERFTVVWNQCSLEHNETWLRESDRVLAPGGRFAVTFQLRGQRAESPGGPFSRWTLSDLVTILTDMGYSIIAADDITERDIRIGWQALDRKLIELEPALRAFLSNDWVQQARQSFGQAIEDMRTGRYGNGRIVAVKRLTSPRFALDQAATVLNSHRQPPTRSSQ